MRDAVRRAMRGCGSADLSGHRHGPVILVLIAAGWDDRDMQRTRAGETRGHDPRALATGTSELPTVLFLVKQSKVAVCNN